MAIKTSEKLKRIFKIVSSSSYCISDLNYNEITKLQNLGYCCYALQGGIYSIEK